MLLVLVVLVAAAEEEEEVAVVASLLVLVEEDEEAYNGKDDGGILVLDNDEGRGCGWKARQAKGARNASSSAAKSTSAKRNDEMRLL